MSWLLSPNGCRGRIRESLLHPLCRKFPPRAASLAKEQQPELANAANRNWNKKFQCSSTGNKPHTTVDLLRMRGVHTQPCWSELSPPWASGVKEQGCPHTVPQPLALPCIYLSPFRAASSLDNKAWKPSHTSCTEYNSKSFSLLQHMVIVLAFFIHFSFPCQGKDCFFHLLEEKSLGC